MLQTVKDGKSIIIEGFHLDPGLYLYEFGKYGVGHLTGSSDFEGLAGSPTPLSKQARPGSPPAPHRGEGSCLRACSRQARPAWAACAMYWWQQGAPAGSLLQAGSCRQHNCRARCVCPQESVHDVNVSAVQVSSADLQQPAQASQARAPSSPPAQPADGGPAPCGADPAGAPQEQCPSERANAAEAALSAGAGLAGPRRKAAADDSLQPPGGRHLRATLQRPSARMLFALTSREDRHQPVLTSWEEAIAQVHDLLPEVLRCRLPVSGGCMHRAQGAHAEEAQLHA